MTKQKTTNKVSLYNRWLNGIETVGNKLPHPIALFAIFAGAMVLLSAICSLLGVSATGTMVQGGVLAENVEITVQSLLTKEGLTFMLTKAVSNFTSYAPLGMVLVAMLGVGVAERSGLINTLLKSAVKVTPAKLITPMVVFLGVMSNIASDAGYVILIPLGAMIFRAYGRHPMAGLAAAFAGVSGGFSANLLIGTLDPTLAGISTEAASLINPNYEVAVMGNYFFLFVSTFLITILGTFVTNKIVEPRLGKYVAETSEEDDTLTTITDKERKGLRNAGIVALIYVAVIVIACIPENSFMRNENGALFGNPSSTFVNSIVILITFLFMLPGIAYGKTVGVFTKNDGVCNAMSKSMASMGSFLALAFVSAQFIQYFSYTNLGTIIAIKGANFLQSVNIGLIPLMIIFVLFSAFMNLFMGSASAKWNILAPVFVPMFMQLGYSPELCQLAYRIGDSSTNIITPMMTYFAVIIVFAQRYDKKASIGTITATMIPYSLVFLLGWTIMLIIWLAFSLPIGPGVDILYTAM